MSWTPWQSLQDAAFKIARLNGAAVHALLVSLHRQRHGEHVLGGEGRVGMALSASIGQIGFAHRRFCCRLTPPLGAPCHGNSGRWVRHRSSWRARGRECSSCIGSLPSSGRWRRTALPRVAGFATSCVPWQAMHVELSLGFAQHRMRAGAELGGHIVMACQAGGRRCFCRVATLGRPGMAIRDKPSPCGRCAPKNAGFTVMGFPANLPSRFPVRGRTDNHRRRRRAWGVRTATNAQHDAKQDRYVDPHGFWTWG